MTIQWLINGLILLLIGWCALSDLTARRIPNVAVLLMVLCAIIQSFSTGVWIDWRTAIGALVIGLALFLLGCFGAGDVKYFWACMLVVPNQIENLLITTSLAGLVLAVVYLAKHRFRPKEVDTIPYGVAISAGLALCLSRIFI